MKYSVILSLEARLDLADIFDYLSKKTGDDFARAYIRRIVDHCDGFSTFPKRGTLRDDIEPGLRLVGYRRKATIAFRVDEDTVTIARILYGGKSFGEADDLDEDEP